jgi:hypothetical protein
MKGAALGRMRQCRRCERRYFGRHGRPRNGTDVTLCPTCAAMTPAEETLHAIAEAEWIERRFAAAKAYNRRVMHLTDADCYGPSPLASAVEV